MKTKMNSKPYSVLKRLFQYVVKFKLRIVLATIILIAAVGTQLAGPYIAKVIIDQHIQGINKVWYQTSPQDASSSVPSVSFRGKSYVREDWLPNSSQQLKSTWQPTRISQVGNNFYMIPQNIPVNGKWALAAPNQIEITLDGQKAIYSAFQLSLAEVRDFYAEDFIPVLWLIGLFVLLLVISSLLTYFQSYLLQSTALRIIQIMRMEIMQHIQRIPLRFFDNTPIGQVVTRITNDTEAIKELFVSFMATFMVSCINMLGIIVALFLLDYRLACITLLLVPLFVVIMRIHLKYSKVYIAIMRARLSDMNAMINESIAVMPIIQAFHKEKDRLQEFEVLNQDRYINQVKQFRVFSLSSRNVSGFIGSLVTASVIWYFGNTSLHTAISFGVFYAFIDYLGRFYQPIIGIFDQLLNAQRAVIAAERVFHLLDEPTEDNKPGLSAGPVDRPQGDVKFDRVSFAYKDEKYVLKDISFAAKQGETVALVGHTGSGKSSVMNLLLGFYEANRGSITIDGRDITTYSKQELRKYMGIVLQDPFLFAGDIKFNVSLYNENIDLDKVKQAIKEVGAAGFVEQLPNGYNEPVVERGSTLSAGQRQLISFARALAFDPSILILDEATASIDSETEGLIQQALKVLSAGRTTFIIAHRLSTIKDANQILVLHRGEIVEHGNHEELMSRQGRYYRMYQLQKGESAVTA